MTCISHVNRCSDLTWSPRAAWMKLRRISYVSLVSLVLGLYTMPTISSIPSDSSVKPFILFMSCLSSSLFLLLHHTMKNKLFKRFKDHDTMNEWMHASKQYAFLIRLTLLSSPPASEVWFSDSCLPFLFHPVCRPETALLRWAHLCACGRSEICPLATPSWSSVEKTQTLTTGLTPVF